MCASGKIDIFIPSEWDGRMAESKMQQPVAEADVDRAGTPANMLQEYALGIQNATAKELMDEWAMLERTHERLVARLRQQEGYKIYT